MGTGTFKSVLPETTWPAIASQRGAALLALQYQLEQSQWLSADEIRRNQFRQIENVVRHTAATVPFYRRRFTESGFDAAAALDDKAWQKLPLLTRFDVQGAGDRLLSTAVPKTHGKTNSLPTSGSSGTPVTITGTQLTQLFWLAFTLRDHLWHGLDPSKKFAAIRHQLRGGAEYPGTESKGWGQATGAVFVTGPSFSLNIMTPVAKQIEWLQQYKPDYLLTYPSNLMALLQHCRETGEKIPPLQLVESIGEILYPEMRSECRDVWGVKIADMYTTQEVGYVALQCPVHEHYHMQSENVLVEVIDEQGRACTPGETGRVVVTTLHNFAMPLLRYSLGDFATVGKPCPCGRGLPVLTRIMGRVRNMLTLPSGEKIWPYFGGKELRDIAPLRQFQLVQKARSELELRLVVERALTKTEEEAVCGRLTKRLGAPFAIAITYHDAIARGPGGKYEDFKSELPA